MRYVLKVAYDGTNFCGWQSQKNGRSVQEELNGAIFSAFGERACVVASGRTDSGVHAAAQICHVDLEKEIKGTKLADALNFFLSDEVSVLCSDVAPKAFDANLKAKRKTYVYTLYVFKRRNPLKDRYAVRVSALPDLEKLKYAASLFVGEHDFAAYCASGSKVKTTVRTVYSFDISVVDDEVKFAVCGNGFLYNMVRTLVGTVIDYASDKLSEERIIRSLQDGDRNKVGKTMIAKGLTLVDVDYGMKLF